ncbi:MAG TPA: hypothetical protein VFS00_01705 [Polyangiaceae bacterium]|nr:hypothetical protein [Polyangiaceae bacterium]
MNLLTTSLQPAETPGGAPRVTSFSATPDQDPMRNFGYTVSAYALIWIMLVGFWLLSWRRQRALEARLGEVERSLDKASPRAPAAGS